MSVRMEALRIAQSQVGVRETSRNSGAEVDAYLSSVGLGPGFSWCAAFVHWCFEVGAASVQLANPCPHTAGALRLWDLCEPHERDREPTFVAVQPGDVFVIDHGHGQGHVGFVESTASPETLWTIEGNTNPGGSREGDGVYRRQRSRAEITRGYLRIGD